MYCITFLNLQAHDNQLESLPDELAELQEIGRLNLRYLFLEFY